MEFITYFINSIQWLTMYEAALCIINLFLLVKYMISTLSRVRWLDYVPGAGVLVAIASYIHGDATLPALVLYALTLIVFLCTVPKIWRPSLGQGIPRRLIWRILLFICGVLPLLFVLAVAAELRYNPVTEASHKSYSEAFVEMNTRLSVEYPFGDWKNIDWEALQTTYEPIFEQADKEQDPVLYYKTLMDYLYSLQDGHVEIVNDELFENNSIFRSEVGGGFGISTVRLDNGRVLVDLVLTDSPADKSGIRIGTEIVKWNGVPAGEAYKSTVWSDNPPSTADVEKVNQGRFMVRAPIGQDAQIEYRNSDSNATQSTILTAYDDQFETLKKTRIKLTPADLEKSPIESKVLNHGYGYVRIKYFLSTADPAKELEQIILDFQKQNVKGLILDLRDNPGGEDELAALMAGNFTTEEKHYEHVSYYNRNTHSFKLNPLETLRVIPSKVVFTGPIAVLINHRTGSSSEGIPLMLKGQSNVIIVGSTGTNGSFGIISRPITFEMPEDYIVQFPDGRSLNENMEIQLDSNGKGVGGVAPDVRVPLTEETFKDKYIQGADIELQAAIRALEEKAGKM